LKVLQGAKHEIIEDELIKEGEFLSINGEEFLYEVECNTINLHFGKNRVNMCAIEALSYESKHLESLS
jgi:hypothetical protein